MKRTIVVLLLACGLAVAAPIPKTGAKLEDVFGEIVDSKNECKATMGKGGVLTVKSPKGQVGGDRPFVVKEVKGDFVLSARVKVEYSSDAFPVAANAPAVVVGLAFTSPDDTKLHSRLLWTITRPRNGNWEGAIHFASTTRKNGGMYAPKPCPKDGSLYFRITRESAWVIAEVSEDGKKWELYSGGLGHADMADRLTVGPVVQGASDQEFTATFDHYEIKPLKEEKK